MCHVSTRGLKRAGANDDSEEEKEAERMDNEFRPDVERFDFYFTFGRK